MPKEDVNITVYRIWKSEGHLILVYDTFVFGESRFESEQLVAAGYVIPLCGRVQMAPKRPVEPVGNPSAPEKTSNDTRTRVCTQHLRSFGLGTISTRLFPPLRTPGNGSFSSASTGHPARPVAVAKHQSRFKARH